MSAATVHIQIVHHNRLLCCIIQDYQGLYHNTSGGEGGGGITNTWGWRGRGEGEGGITTRSNSFMLKEMAKEMFNNTNITILS